MIGNRAPRATHMLGGSRSDGVRATDVPTFQSTAALMVGVGLFARMLPAYRARGVDPLKTLRDD